MRMRTLVLLAAGCSFPGGLEAGTCPVNIPHLNGRWVTLPYQLPLNPISTTLLHTGKVLIVAGSENDAADNTYGTESYRVAIWNPASVSKNVVVQGLEYDVFCSGTAVLPDGRPLVVGGTSNYGLTGDNRASLFDPVGVRFAQSESMVDGRWYATATTLGDGRTMAFSGTGSSGTVNQTVEIYDLANAGAGWNSPQTAPFAPPLYPRMELLPNGTVFFTGQGAGTATATGWIFDPVPETWNASATVTTNRVYGTAVMLPLLPPSFTPKVMNFGGSGNNTTEIIDLSATLPTWAPGPNMSAFRIMIDATLLPTGQVLAQGGSASEEVPDDQGKSADLYDPVAGTMSSAGTAAFSRLYHSTALLLPDATVMSVGSNPGDRGRYEPAIEIYTPPYLFDSSDRVITNRATITGVIPGGTALGYGTPFSVSYTSPSPISAAVLVRPGSTTHSFDMEQRLIGLCGPPPQPACNTSGNLSLTTPPNGNIAPPGYYMLFLIDRAGVPSKAQFIQLSTHGSTPPSGSITTPSTNVTISAGGSVIFGTTSTVAQYSWVFPGGSPTTSVAQNPGAVTFSTPGSYVVSLTVIDATGNSDPSPPTRTIKVLPGAPDFYIHVTPNSQAVIPGGNTTFNVKLTSISGFSGSVNLGVASENPFPAGVTSLGFVPAAITGSGTSVLTMATTAAATPYALSLTVTGTSGTLSHSVPTTLIVRIAPPTGLSATPSGTGQVTLTWSASVGATGYTIRRSTVQRGALETIACVSGTSFVDNGLTTGTTYYYVVAADYSGGPNGGGDSANSVEVKATP
jgi:PKD repeat protein